MVPSTLDMEPSTLDPRQKDRLAGMMLCCLFAYISVFCLDRCHFALVPVKEDSASPPSSPGASWRGYQHTLVGTVVAVSSHNNNYYFIIIIIIIIIK